MTSADAKNVHLDLKSEEYVKPLTPASSESDDLVSECDSTHVLDPKALEPYQEAQNAPFSPFQPVTTTNAPYPGYWPQHTVPATFVPFAPPGYADGAIQPMSRPVGYNQLGLIAGPSMFHQNTAREWNNNSTTNSSCIQPQRTPSTSTGRPRVVSQEGTVLPSYFIPVQYEVPSQNRQLYHSTSAPDLQAYSQAHPLPQGRVLDITHNDNSNNVTTNNGKPNSDRNGLARSEKVRICTDMLDSCEKQSLSLRARTGRGWARVSDQTTHSLKFMMTVGVLILLVLSALFVFVYQCECIPLFPILFTVKHDLLMVSFSSSPL
jgi:hypothetical protein